MEKYNIILHTTTNCNYNCSYCFVVKNRGTMDGIGSLNTIRFIKNNHRHINSFKFFGGEPLLVFGRIKEIIDNTHEDLTGKFEIVTNTSLLSSVAGEYFHKYFGDIFFSIDNENAFDFQKVISFLDEHKIRDKVYFNLIISPLLQAESFKNFELLYKNGIRKFNLLPVYFTKEWSKSNLYELSNTLKKIIDIAIVDKSVDLYGFQRNNGYNYTLTYKSLFIDVDSKIYFTDLVSTFAGQDKRKELYIGDLNNIDLSAGIEIDDKIRFLDKFEPEIIGSVKGQTEVHKIMDYFSKYLNENNGI